MPPDVSGFDSDVIDASIEGKKLTLTPKKAGTTTATVAQGAWSAGNYGKASNKVNIKVNVMTVQIPEATIALTTDMVFNWDGTDHASLAETAPSGVVCQLNERLENTTGFAYVYGNGISSNTYLNLCDADNMVVVVDNAAGSPVFHYNNGMNYDGADHHESYSWESKGYLTKVIESTITTWIIDIKKIREAEGHFHLNAITTLWQGNTQVNSIKIDKYVDPIKSETERLAAGDDQKGWTGLNTLTFNGGSQEGFGTPKTSGYGRFNNITSSDYVDLGSYNVLKYVIYTQDPGNSSKAISTTARSIFNTGSSPEIKLAETEDSPYLYVNDLSSTFYLKIYYVNLKAIKRTYGTVYLNAIKEVWNSEGNKIMLYEMPCVK